jgi:hypothetical protein
MKKNDFCLPGRTAGPAFSPPLPFRVSVSGGNAGAGGEGGGAGRMRFGREERGRRAGPMIAEACP